MGHVTGETWLHASITMIVWSVISGIFVFLRLATRYRLGPDRLGYDDWILLAAWFLALLKGILFAVSYFPLFQGMTIIEYYSDPDLDMHFRAEMTFGVALFVGGFEELLVRSAVIAFLYRLAMNKWHKRVLILVLIPCICFSIMMAVMYLLIFVHFANHPFDFNFFNFSEKPSWAYFSWYLFVDFFCALFPWYMLRNVRMKRSKKMLICGSLSLTLIAAGCAIAKLYLVLTWTLGQDVIIGYILTNYERGIFMVCVSIPALLPLWTHYREKKARKRAAAAGLDPEKAGPQVVTVGGGGVKKFGGAAGAPGDGVINDPRMEALLVETVPTGTYLDHDGGRQKTDSSTTTGLNLSRSREKGKVEPDTTDAALPATVSSQVASVPRTSP